MEMISVQEGIACAQFVKGYPLSEKVYKLFSWAKLVTTCDLDADLSGGHLWQTMRLGVHVLFGNGNLNISAMHARLRSATVAAGLQFINSYGDETKTGS